MNQTTEMSITEKLTPNGKLYVLVHKKDESETITIDPDTGLVDRSVEVPDWAEHLFLGQVTEFRYWLFSKFGPEIEQEYGHPEVYGYEALGWLTAHADGHGLPVEGYIEPDREHRMEMAATILGVDLTAQDFGVAFSSVTKLLAEAEIAMDFDRTHGELADLKATQGEPFGAIEDTERRTGTKG